MSWAGPNVASPAGAMTRTGEITLPEIGERVDRHAVLAQLEVQVRARARTRAAGLPDRVARRRHWPGTTAATTAGESE